MPRNPFRRQKTDGTLDDGTGGDGVNALITSSRPPSNSGTHYLPLVPSMSTGGGSNVSITSNQIWFFPAFSGCGGTLSYLTLRTGNQNAASGQGCLIAIWQTNNGWPYSRISNIAELQASGQYALNDLAMTDTSGNALVLTANTWYWIGIQRDGSATGTQQFHTPTPSAGGTQTQFHTNGPYYRSTSFTLSTSNGTYKANSPSMSSYTLKYDTAPLGGLRYSGM